MQRARATMTCLAFRDLARRPWRFAYTGGGVAVAACAYTLLVGSAARFVRQFHDLSPLAGADLVVQQKEATSPTSSALSDALAARLREVPGVGGVSRVAFGRTRVQGSPWFLVGGLNADEPLARRLPIEEGRRLHGGGSQILFGVSGAATRGVRPGSVVEIRGERLSVAGLFRSQHAFLDAAAVVELRDAQRLFNLPGMFNIALVDLAPGMPPAQVATQIAARIPGVEVTTVPALIGTLPLVRLARQFTRLVGLLAVGIAALGAANVLSLSVQERTQEIAVLRAVGWRRRRIAALILGEGLCVSLAGGLASVPLCAVALMVLGRCGPGADLGLLPVYPPPAAVLEALAVTALAGVLGSAPPVARALTIAPASAFKSA